jgi:hypothetical protein
MTSNVKEEDPAASVLMRGMEACSLCSISLDWLKAHTDTEDTVYVVGFT